ncbi:MAG: hypothetical protein WC516_04945 [Patescibacteria group bacterium]|jgi:hypothetical protein
MKTRVRLFQAGDLPGYNERINIKKVRRLIKACEGLMAWGYTHKPPHIGNNKKIIKYCNKNGLTINLSANNLTHADKLYNLKIGPVVVTLPKDCGKRVVTPAGRKVMICPAINSNTTCKTCGGLKGALCYRADRNYIIGFPAHGFASGKVSKIVEEND